MPVYCSLICICPISRCSFIWCDVTNFTTSQWIIGSIASWGNRITTFVFYWKSLERGEGTKYLAFRTGYNALLSFEIGLLCTRSLSLSKSAHRLWSMIRHSVILWHDNASITPPPLLYICKASRIRQLGTFWVVLWVGPWEPSPVSIEIIKFHDIKL